MIGADSGPFATEGAPSPPDRSAADEETLQALEQMLANPDARLSDESAPPASLDRCALMREMMERLDTLGPAGQADVMGRVIALLVDEAEASGMGDGNRRAYRDQLERLRHEAQRPWPDALSFCRRAENLIAMLGPPPAGP